MQKCGRQVAVTGKPVFIIKPQHSGGLAGLFLQLFVFHLREIDELLVMAEIHVAQFRMAVEAERFDNNASNGGPGIRQEKRSEILVPPGLEGGIAGEKGKTVRTGDALDLFFFAKPVEQAAGAAIGIGDEDAPEAFGRGPCRWRI